MHFPPDFSNSGCIIIHYDFLNIITLFFDIVWNINSHGRFHCFWTSALVFPAVKVCSTFVRFGCHITFLQVLFITLNSTTFLVVNPIIDAWPEMYTYSMNVCKIIFFVNRYDIFMYRKFIFIQTREAAIILAAPTLLPTSIKGQREAITINLIIMYKFMLLWLL